MARIMPTTPCTILKGIPVAEDAMPAAMDASFKEPLPKAERPASYRKYPKTMMASPTIPPIKIAINWRCLELPMCCRWWNNNPAMPAVSALMINVAGAQDAYPEKTSENMEPMPAARALQGP